MYKNRLRAQNTELLLQMEKSKTHSGRMGSVNEVQSENVACNMRKRRRASQAKHRRQVASCYEKLRKSVPGAHEKVTNRSPSAKTKAKPINKAALLDRSKQYILHLESILASLLKENTSSDTTDSTTNNPVLRTIMKFQNVEEFREHFAQRFDANSDVMSYFQKQPLNGNHESSTSTRKSREPFGTSPTILNLSHVLADPENSSGTGSTGTSSQSSSKSKGSSEHSDDLGFFSGEGGSQDRCCHRQNSQSSSQRTSSGHSIGFRTFGSPFQLQPTVVGAYPNGAFFDNSHFYFYVPAVGYPAPFYTPYNEYLQPLLGEFSPGVPEKRVGGKVSAKTDDPKADGCGELKSTQSHAECVRGKPSVTSDCCTPTTKPFVKVIPQKVSALLPMGAQTVGERLTVEYEYGEPDGSLSPPRICLTGSSEDQRENRHRLLH